MKGPGMIKGTYPAAFPLKHQQKDLRLALALGCARKGGGWRGMCVGEGRGCGISRAGDDAAHALAP